MTKLYFDKDEAVRYGLVEAILLQALRDMLAASWGDSNCYEKGESTWLRLTLTQLHAELPFLSAYRIRTALDNLLYEKLVKTDESSAQIGLRRRKLVGYALTERGRATGTVPMVPMAQVRATGTVPMAHFHEIGGDAQ